MTLKITRLDTRQIDFDTRLKEVLAFTAKEDASIDRVAADIISDVRKRGDIAVLEYTNRFDGLNIREPAALEISAKDCEAAFENLSPARKKALMAAADRIRAYHTHQREACGGSGYTYTDEHGSLLGQRITPIDRVGIYVPGGKAAYPSSVLMNAIPAKVAGVPEIIMAVPTPKGERNELVLAAAKLAGVNRIFAVGGAQAIAALAYGTQTIPAVDKIVGPGNAFVAAAKRRVFGQVGIDMIAGPSEILVLCDGTTNPDWVAMDLFSQAEHDELAQSILISHDAAYLDAVHASMEKLLHERPRRAIIEASLTGRGAFILAQDKEDACAIANRIAPEHLEISAEDPDSWLPLLRHAGAIFMGRFASEALGDYCAGPNHVLPTSRTARFSSPLGVYDFQKRSSLIRVSEEGASILGEIAVELAQGESLEAHAKSAAFRIFKN